MAYEGEGEQHPGDWCRFGRAKSMCKGLCAGSTGLAREEFLDLDEGALEEERISAETETTDATAPYNPDTDAPVFKAPGLVSLADLEEIILP